MADGDAGADPVSACVAWVESRTSTAFKHVKADKFKKAFTDPDNMCVPQLPARSAPVRSRCVTAADRCGMTLVGQPLVAPRSGG